MMNVSNWMKHPVHTVKPRDTVLRARALLEEYRINQLPVVADGRIVGIITDRDLRDAFPSVFETAAANARGEEPETFEPARVAVETIMTRNVAVTSPDESLTSAARLMRKKRIGALPVVAQAKLVGILTRSDVLDALAVLLNDVEPVR